MTTRSRPPTASAYRPRTSPLVLRLDTLRRLQRSSPRVRAAVSAAASKTRKPQNAALRGRRKSVGLLLCDRPARHSQVALDCACSRYLASTAAWLNLQP